MNKTLYVPDEHADTWKEAARLLRFQRDQSLSAYITSHLTAYVERQRIRSLPKSAKPVKRKPKEPGHD